MNKRPPAAIILQRSFVSPLAGRCVNGTKFVDLDADFFLQNC